jgi:L-glutamine-phosphate cytidylyltransferase
MKIVILAAGLGSRLDGSQDHLPKPLTRLASGKSILEYQLDALAWHLSLDDVFVVVGYHKEAILEAFPHLAYVYNPLFAQENTSKSLLRALSKIEEDVLWLNGDVIFRPSILQEILELDRTCMVVNEAIVGEEEVKYRADGQGRILEVSKQVQQPQGEALGINFFKQEDLPALRKNLENCAPGDYFEKAIECLLHQGKTVWTMPVSILDCVEIDFPADLEKANQMMMAWEQNTETM